MLKNALINGKKLVRLDQVVPRSSWIDQLKRKVMVDGSPVYFQRVEPNSWRSEETWVSIFRGGLFSVVRNVDERYGHSDKWDSSVTYDNSFSGSSNNSFEDLVIDSYRTAHISLLQSETSLFSQELLKEFSKNYTTFNLAEYGIAKSRIKDLYSMHTSWKDIVILENGNIEAKYSMKNPVKLKEVVWYDYLNIKWTDTEDLNEGKPEKTFTINIPQSSLSSHLIKKLTLIDDINNEIDRLTLPIKKKQKTKTK